ncbi:MAG: efflux RND transporter periplasmic adaptor subunit, partial [Gemmatimonadales bacterium]
GGEPVVVVQEAPRAPGIFGPRPVFPRAGMWDLQIEIASSELHDTLRVASLEVHADSGSAPIAAPEADDGAISFLKEQAWKTPGFLTAFAVDGHVEEVREVTAALTPTSGRVAVITAPIAGIIARAGGRGVPFAGERVRAGNTVALLTPLLGEGGSALASARAALATAEAEYARAGRLVQAEAAPARRLEEARIERNAAREALRGFGGATTNDGRIAIRTPIDGVVSTADFIPGARVEAGDRLLSVVNADQLWLEAKIPGDAVSDIQADGRIRFRVGESWHTTSSIVALAPTIDLATRTVTGRWVIDNRGGALRPGMLATALIPTAAIDRGVVIPASAILDDDGQAIAFVQLSGESFERRVLTLGARGSERVVVRAGIRAGERVVTGAANQVRLASLSTAVPAHGHEHLAPRCSTH